MNAFRLCFIGERDQKVADLPFAGFNARLIRRIIQKTQSTFGWLAKKGRDPWRLEIESNLRSANSGIVEAHIKVVNKDESHPFSRIPVGQDLPHRYPKGRLLQNGQFL